MAQSCLEAHKCQAVKFHQDGLSVSALVLRIAVAGTLVSLSSAAFWVLLLEIARQ
jgi:hypothetical protein